MIFALRDGTDSDTSRSKRSCSPHPLPARELPERLHDQEPSKSRRGLVSMLNFIDVRPSDSLESKCELRFLWFPSKRKTSFSEEGRARRRSTWTSLVAEVAKYFSSAPSSISLRRIEIGESVLFGLGVPAPRGELAGVDDAGEPGVSRWGGMVAIHLKIFLS